MNSANLNADQDTDLARVISILSYLTLIGWVVAIVLFGSHKSSIARFHLRQSFGLIVTAAILSFIPLIGWALNIVVAIFWLISLYFAICQKSFLVPFIGEYFQSHLDFIR